MSLNFLFLKIDAVHYKALHMTTIIVTWFKKKHIFLSSFLFNLKTNFRGYSTSPSSYTNCSNKRDKENSTSNKFTQSLHEMLSPMFLRIVWHFSVAILTLLNFSSRTCKHPIRFQHFSPFFCFFNWSKVIFFSFSLTDSSPLGVVKSWECSTLDSKDD